MVSSFHSNLSSIANQTKFKRNLIIEIYFLKINERIGSACAVLNRDDDLWYRGIIQGPCDNQPSQIRVHLVDLGRVIVVDASSIRELPQSYRKVICMKKQPNP